MTATMTLVAFLDANCIASAITGGVIQLLDCSPHDALFFYENAWISVATYFYVRYGGAVTSLNRIAFVKITPNLEDYGDEPMLYPLEFLEIY
ncbi:unnamed protein product [Caenorhabditis nigoni]